MGNTVAEAIFILSPNAFTSRCGIDSPHAVMTLRSQSISAVPNSLESGICGGASGGGGFGAVDAALAGVENLPRSGTETTWRQDAQRSLLPERESSAFKRARHLVHGKCSI